MQEQPPFPKIGREFFESYGKRPTEETWHKWESWLRDHPRVQDRSKYIKCLALCAIISDSQVENWLNPKREGHDRIDPKNVATFRAATDGLGWRQPRSAEADRLLGAPRVKRDPTRAALFTPLAVVSESYHLHVLQSIVHNAASQGVVLSVHELPGGAVGAQERARTVKVVLTKFAPDAVLLLRITPDKVLLKNLVFDEQPLPTVLIHADRLLYPPPVVANIVPNHETLTRDVKGWLWSRPHMRGRTRPKAVMVAMPNESARSAFPKSVTGSASIRNDRIKCIWAALEGFRRARVTVPDYGFRHAWTVWKKHRDADAFVCLSDTLAVGLKHLLFAAEKSQNWRNRVLGFDGSPLAREEGIVSLSQDLDQVGEKALRRLCEFLEDTRGVVKPAWPKPAEIEEPVPVTLADRKHVVGRR